MTGMEFVRIPAGEFVMGSPADEPGHQDNETLHRVRLSKPFYLTVTEVTRRQWDAMMPSANVSTDPDLPIVNVNWFELNAFFEKLSAFRAGRYRLPSEAEWEYACRAGTTTPYSTGATLTTEQANYNGEFPLPGQARGQNRGSLSKAGSFPPNRLGSARHARKRLGVDGRSALPLSGRHVHRSRTAVRHSTQSDPRRQLALQRRQRPLRAPLHAPSAGSRR